MPITPELEAGTLDRRVTLLKPQLNEYGDEIIGWEPVADVWASVAPTYSRGRGEVVEAGRVVATLFIDISIRYRPDLDARWRIKDREKTYEIRAVVDVNRRHARHDLLCLEIA